MLNTYIYTHTHKKRAAGPAPNDELKKTKKLVYAAS
jgi:hypothetical protein